MEDMESVIWAVIGPSVVFLGAALLAVNLVVAIYVALLDGLRIDRWSRFSKLWAGKKVGGQSTLMGGE